MVGIIALAIIVIPAYAYFYAKQINPNNEPVYQADNGDVFVAGENQNNQLGLAFLSNASDVIGTKTGTTTAGVLFNSLDNGTTTYVTKIGNNINQATYTFNAKNASSTPSGQVYLSFLGSNDDYCETATTTTIYDVVTKSQINWFDIGTHLRELAGSQTLGAGTSTMSWAPTGVGQNRTVSLMDLNYECLALQVNASSTELWAQVKMK